MQLVPLYLIFGKAGYIFNFVENVNVHVAMALNSSKWVQNLSTKMVRCDCSQTLCPVMYSLWIDRMEQPVIVKRAMGLETKMMICFQ